MSPLRHDAAQTLARDPDSLQIGCDPSAQGVRGGSFGRGSRRQEEDLSPSRGFIGVSVGSRQEGGPFSAHDGRLADEPSGLQRGRPGPARKGADAVKSRRGTLDVPIGNVPWEEHPNLGTSAGTGVERDVTSVGGDQSGHDGKAESGPCSGSTGFTSPETVEGVGCALTIHARAGVLNLEDRATLHLVHPDRNRGRWGCVSKAVGDQVHDDLAESSGVTFCDHGSVVDYSNLSGGVCRRCVEDGVVSERHDVYTGPVEESTFIESGQEQQVLNQSRHLCARLTDTAHGIVPQTAAT